MARSSSSSRVLSDATRAASMRSISSRNGGAARHLSVGLWCARVVRILLNLGLCETSCATSAQSGFLSQFGLELSGGRDVQNLMTTRMPTERVFVLRGIPRENPVPRVGAVVEVNHLPAAGDSYSLLSEAHAQRIEVQAGQPDFAWIVCDAMARTRVA